MPSGTGRHVDVAELCVLMASALLAACCQTDRPCKVHVEHVHRFTPGLAYTHHPRINVDVLLDLVELPNTHYIYVGCELGDEAHDDEGAVLAVLTHKQHHGDMTSGYYSDGPNRPLERVGQPIWMTGW